MEKYHFLVFALMFSLAFSIAGLASAEPGDGEHHVFEPGRLFGEHVSTHAQMGHLGQDMNPGTHHQGFSPWAPGN